jgi:protein-disulfide isomerase
MNVVTVILTACVVAVSLTYLRRGADRPAARAGAAEITEVAQWRVMASTGIRFGPDSAPVVITQFSDFQCPYCRRLHATLREIARRYPTEVAFVFRHYPIDRLHPHAREAAYAAECANRWGVFPAFHDVVFTRQDSIGTIPWSDFATRAGIARTDLERFVLCMRDEAVQARVAEDSIAARQLYVRGTPTVLVNQWRLPGTPKLEQLDSVVGNILRAVRLRTPG